MLNKWIDIKNDLLSTIHFPLLITTPQYFWVFNSEVFYTIKKIIQFVKRERYKTCYLLTKF